MRRKEQHIKHCEYIVMPGISSSERSHYSKVYGINRLTVLLKLPDFDVAQQLPQDIMHVLLEGIFPYGTATALHHRCVIFSDSSSD